MNPGDSAWWWEHGLDGLVAGLFGALATGLAVWLSLRHERRLRQEDAAAIAASRLVAAAGALSDSADRGSWTELEALSTSVAVMEMAGRCNRRWPSVTKALIDRGLVLERETEQPTPDSAVVSEKAAHLAKVALAWIGDAKDTEKQLSKGGLDLTMFGT